MPVPKKADSPGTKLAPKSGDQDRVQSQQQQQRHRYRSPSPTKQRGGGIAAIMSKGDHDPEKTPPAIPRTITITAEELSPLSCHHNPYLRLNGTSAVTNNTLSHPYHISNTSSSRGQRSDSPTKSIASSTNRSPSRRSSSTHRRSCLDYDFDKDIASRSNSRCRRDESRHRRPSSSNTRQRSPSPTRASRLLSTTTTSAVNRRREQEPKADDPEISIRSSRTTGSSGRLSLIRPTMTPSPSKRRSSRRSSLLEQVDDHLMRDKETTTRRGSTATTTSRLTATPDKRTSSPSRHRRTSTTGAAAVSSRAKSPSTRQQRTIVNEPATTLPPLRGASPSRHSRRTEELDARKIMALPQQQQRTDRRRSPSPTRIRRSSVVPDTNTTNNNSSLSDISCSTPNRRRGVVTGGRGGSSRPPKDDIDKSRHSRLTMTTTEETIMNQSLSSLSNNNNATIVVRKVVAKSPVKTPPRCVAKAPENRTITETLDFADFLSVQLEETVAPSAIRSPEVQSSRRSLESMFHENRNIAEESKMRRSSAVTLAAPTDTSRTNLLINHFEKMSPTTSPSRRIRYCSSQSVKEHTTTGTTTATPMLVFHRTSLVDNGRRDNVSSAKQRGSYVVMSPTASSRRHSTVTTTTGSSPSIAPSRFDSPLRQRRASVQAPPSYSARATPNNSVRGTSPRRRSVQNDSRPGGGINGITFPGLDDTSFSFGVDSATVQTSTTDDWTKDPFINKSHFSTTPIRTTKSSFLAFETGKENQGSFERRRNANVREEMIHSRRVLH